MRKAAPVILALLFGVMFCSQTRAQSFMEKCQFQTICNRLQHGIAAAGIVVAADVFNIPPELGIAASTVLYIGKELRDNHKWPGTWGSRDSIGDIIAPVFSAVFTTMVIRAIHRHSRRTVPVVVTPKLALPDSVEVR